MNSITPAKRGWKSYLLIGSLGLNLLLVGLIAGATVKGPNGQGAGGGNRNQLRSIVQALPVEKRKELKALYKSKRAENRGKRKAVRASSIDLIAAIQATPFDRAALVDAFNTREAAARQSGGAGRAALIDIITSLSDQERADVADHMITTQDRRKGRKKD